MGIIQSVDGEQMPHIKRLLESKNNIRRHTVETFTAYNKASLYDKEKRHGCYFNCGRRQDNK